MENGAAQETQQVKFSIAAIFALLAALQTIFYGINIILRYGSSLQNPAIHVLNMIFSVLFCIFLFMRKRDFLLAIPICMQPLLSLLSALQTIKNRNILCEAGIVFLELLIDGILVLLILSVCYKPTARFTLFVRKCWFLPGYFCILHLAVQFPAYRNIVTTLLYVMISIPMVFLLGWWITHPFKTPKPMAYAQAPNQGTPYNAPVKVFCSGCGREFRPQEAFCVSCGRQRPAAPSASAASYASPAQPAYGVPDAPSGSMTALGFFFPAVGLILYLTWKDQTPLKAKSIGKGALIGGIVWVCLSLIAMLLAALIPILVARPFF